MRLLVLTGAGGSGKTRLALEAAHATAGSFASGAAFVDLAQLHDPELVPGAIARTLAIRETSATPLDALAEALRSHELLLVLDNAEHLLPATPQFVELLARTSHLTLLVTSRAVLHLSGERVYPVEPLATPAAVELFRERARARNRHHLLDEREEEAIRRICERVDGLPLAIELAAAQTRTLAPTELLERLEPRLPLLAGGPRDLPARQQALAATLEWSYALLDDATQANLRRLSIFSGGFTLETAETVCETTLERLSLLVDHSLPPGRRLAGLAVHDARDDPRGRTPAARGSGGSRATRPARRLLPHARGAGLCRAARALRPLAYAA